jgi:aryl-alcohol dehydrogenase-like predicted oxidoreductase
VTIARRRGVSAHRVLLAWLRAQSPAITPLAGASKPGSIRDSATPFGLMDLDFSDLRACLAGHVRRPKPRCSGL